MALESDHCRDFDFQIGAWNVKHRRLTERLVNCDTWEEFAGTCVMQTTLGGNGNMDDNVLHIPSGTYRAVTLRAFDPATQTWAIWWLDSRNPHALDVPVIGRFEDGIGAFYACDEVNGTAVIVRFLWTKVDTDTPEWAQAMSVDDGKTWETNWTMTFERAVGG